jgi:predicted  nucleic acid-binding Zn-ribbon protein
MDTDYLRYHKEWELGPDLSELGKRANALFQFLIESDELKQADDDTQEEINRLQKRKFELEKEIEKSDSPTPELVSQLGQIEQELEAYYEEYSDVYDIELDDETYYDHVHLFNIPKIEQSYMVGEDFEMEDAATEYLKQLFDDIGYSHLPDWLLESAINEDDVVSTFKESFEQSVREEPENYLDDSDKELTNLQKRYFQSYSKQLENLNKKISAIQEILKNTKDDEKKEMLKNFSESLDREFEYLDEKITEITDNPEGDYKPEAIEDLIELMVDRAKDDVIRTMEEYDLEMENYIDKDEVVRLVLRNDGLETMSSYDGQVNEEIVDGTVFYIIRVE